MKYLVLATALLLASASAGATLLLASVSASAAHHSHGFAAKAYAGDCRVAGAYHHYWVIDRHGAHAWICR